MVVDSKLLTGVPLDMTLTFDLLTSKCHQFSSVLNCN